MQAKTFPILGSREHHETEEKRWKGLIYVYIVTLAEWLQSTENVMFQCLSEIIL